MTRLSYVENTESQDIKKIVKKISSQRDGNLPNLFKMLLQSPKVAEGWFEFLSSIRNETILNSRTRELVILYVALLLNAPYPQNDHVPIALKEGITKDEIDQLKNWHTSTLYNNRDKALLAYVEESSKNIKVPDNIFMSLRKEYNNREIIEITVLIGAYHMVSRFLEALQIDLEVM